MAKSDTIGVGSWWAADFRFEPIVFQQYRTEIVFVNGGDDVTGGFVVRAR